MHWCAKYIGKEWTEKRDCGWWFRFWSRVYFGRRVPPIIVNHDNHLTSTARAMRMDIRASYGFAPTEMPREGDAVFLSQRRRPHHLGMIVFVDGEKQVLHALEEVGVVLSDTASLFANGWRVVGCYGYCGEK